MSSWKKVKLSEIIESINTGLDAIRRAPIVDFSTDIRCLRIQDISQNKDFNNWGFTEVKDIDYQKFQLKKDDIIMARTCSTGICFLVKNDLSAVFNNGLARIRVNSLKVDPKYLFYVFKSSDFKGYIDGISGGTSVQLNMKIGDLSKYEFHLPPLDIQKKIATYLSILDDKIQLNTQINQTLEQIAKAIFKSWFIDFDPVKAKAEAKAQDSTDEQANIAAMSMISGKSPDQLNAHKQTNPTDYQQLLELAQAFPSEFEEIDGVEVPKGWEITNFGAVSECFDKKRIPLSKRQREQKIGNIPYYGATSVMDYVNEAIFNDIYLLIGEDGSVLKDDGTPFIQYIWGESWVNNHAHVLKGKDCVSTEHLMLFMSLTNIRSYITGAVQMKLNQANMNRIPFIKATNEINILFSKYISSFYEQIRFFSDENKNLMKVRDLLLPKLLSGEI